MKLEKIAKLVNETKARSAWDKGVKEYAMDIMAEVLVNHDSNDIKDTEALRKACLNGASTWVQFSYAGWALCSDCDIAERLCTPSELKKVKGGGRRPNSRETWFGVQARALLQAWNLILKYARVEG